MLSLQYAGRPVLGADLNCSESVWALSGSASQMIARQQEPVAVRNLNPAYVRFGSKAEKPDLSIRCPLYPQKRTNRRRLNLSALCQKRINESQQKSTDIRSPRRHSRNGTLYLAANSAHCGLMSANFTTLPRKWPRPQRV